MVKRKGLRRPAATIRRAFAFVLAAFGLSGRPSPVAGSTRRMVPPRTIGSPAALSRLWLRSAPPSAVGGVCEPPTGTGGPPQGFVGVGVPDHEPPPWP